MGFPNSLTSSSAPYPLKILVGGGEGGERRGLKRVRAKNRTMLKEFVKISGNPGSAAVATGRGRC